MAALELLRKGTRWSLVAALSPLRVHAQKAPASLYLRDYVVVVSGMSPALAAAVDPWAVQVLLERATHAGLRYLDCAASRFGGRVGGRVYRRLQSAKSFHKFATESRGRAGGGCGIAAAGLGLLPL